MRIWVASLLSLGLVSPVRAVEMPPRPCQQDPGYAALDFWLGDWDVYAGAALAGTNHIEKLLDGCAVVENWKDTEGSEGKSLFFYNRFTRTWKQVWIYDVGQLKEKTRVADPEPGSVRFQGTVQVAEDRTILDRTTLTPLADGTVRQVIETSRDGGTTWRVGFDAIYRRSALPVACGPAAAELRDVASGILAADNQRDIGRVLAYYADDAVLLPPGEGPVAGRARIRPRYEALFAGFDPQIEGRIEEACVAGDLGLVRGHNGGRLVARGSGATRSLDDAFLMLLRRDAAGAWRISHLMWHPQNPAAGAAR